MSLNIKNERTHELVRELAARTGQSQTSAVEDAVRRRLAELEWSRESERRYRAILEISNRASKAMDPTLSNDPNDFLYDELGLPQ